MKRIVAVLLLLVAACSGSSVEVIAPEDLPPEIYGEAARTVERPETLVVFLVQGNRLVRVGRSGEASGTDEEIAVRELLEGPTRVEIAREIETRMPEGLELLDITVENEVAFANFDRDFLTLQDSADPFEFILRVAQVVWTLDELPSVNAVRFLVEGQPIAVLDQERRQINVPVARKRYQRFEPRSERPVTQAPLQIDI